ncbi:MAG TPA: TetR/AcrR family transcriptional regulator [Streptosporangiaceae bacterium]
MTERSADGATESREQRDRRIRALMERWTAERDGDDREPREPNDQLPREQPSRPPRGPRPTLTLDQIAAAAVGIADADGLDAVTMRRLAARLDVATMSLYRYVKNKEDVYALMLDAVAREITLPAPGSAGWRETLRRIATEMRAGQLRHPWLARLQSSTAFVIAPSVLAVLEAGLAALDAADITLDVDEMVAAFSTMTAYVQGRATAEVAQRETYRRFGWSSDDDMRAAAGPQLVPLLARGDYPTLAHYIVDGSNQDDAEWSFAFGLECILDGIAARLGL